MDIAISGPHSGQAGVCEPILRSLSQWFGIESSIVNYLSDIERLPPFLASQPDRVVGFLTVKQHNSYSAEVLMGFRPLEEFTQIWDEQNPCLIMVERL